MGYKVGDEVLVKAKIVNVNKKFDRPYLAELNASGENWVSEDKIIPMDKTYADGLNDAWNLAKKIVCAKEQGGMKLCECEDVFNTTYIADILAKHTYEEALAKIEAYEREKEIKVGDVVVHGATKTKDVFVVTSIGNGMIRGVKKNGVTNSFTFPNPYIKKTGKYIDIEGLLKQIGE